MWLIYFVYLNEVYGGFFLDEDIKWLILILDLIGKIIISKFFGCSFM